MQQDLVLWMENSRCIFISKSGYGKSKEHRCCKTAMLFAFFINR